MKLWHCAGSRSLRVLWTLEELGLGHELEILPFPPRLRQPEYLAINSLGTVPYFVDGDVAMTESVAICQYLVDRHGGAELALPAGHVEYGAYLNWLHHSDATLTFPQTIYLRYAVLEPDPDKQAAGNDYARWFRSRLRAVEDRVAQSDYLVAERFTVADIAVGYALHLATLLRLDDGWRPTTHAYLERLRDRQAFRRADRVGEPLVLF